MNFQQETERGERFQFGKNWRRFLAVLDQERIDIAVNSLQKVLGLNNLFGRTFLDIGSGSGLFSLSARKLGAKVVSFDYDPQSVGCTEELKRRFFAEDQEWSIERGSILDTGFLDQITAKHGQFDIVYSWGVLHHTGEMWQALDNLDRFVKPGGRLFIAIYNDQGVTSKVWKKVKRFYCQLPFGTKWIVIIPALLYMWTPVLLLDLVSGRGLDRFRNYRSRRGMSVWHDVVDWVGGYPFEVAKPEEIFNFFLERKYRLQYLTTVRGNHGCCEYGFLKENNSL